MGTSSSWGFGFVSFSLLGCLFIAGPRLGRIAATELKPEEQRRVDRAIDAGIEYLRRSQLKTGSWIFGASVKVDGSTTGVAASGCPVGFTALAGLTLLECGAAADDAVIERAARFVRAQVGSTNVTYEVAVSTLFLDRLGRVEDRPVVRSLALRLAASQGPLGGWNYSSPVLTAEQERKLLAILRSKTPADAPKFEPVPEAKGKKPTRKMEGADNSNTQFALLALWRASKHDLPLSFTFALAEQRFRTLQTRAGWPYYFGSSRCNGSMTCVGLLGLAIGRGSRTTDGAKRGEKAEDEAISTGLQALSAYMKDPFDDKSLGAILGPKGTPNFYFLWSVERVGVLCSLKTIGGRDWHRWGLETILPAQRKDGSWVGRGSGGFPVVDTCFALLFLKRSDLLPDLRERLQQRLAISDPGASPGEKEAEK